MNEIQTRATAISEKPVKAGDLAVVKRNILENSREYDKGMVGGYSGTFPLTTATKGGIYLMPSTGKFYVCETDYNGSNLSAPNSNFVELSVWKNHDRLGNIRSYTLVSTIKSTSTERTLLTNLIELINNKVGAFEILITCGTGLSLIYQKYVFVNPGYGNRFTQSIFKATPGPYGNQIEVDSETTDVFVTNAFSVVYKIFVIDEN